MTANSELAAEHRVTIGDVPVFVPKPDRHETARKLGEEATEAFSAFEDWDKADERVRAYSDLEHGMSGLRDASESLVDATAHLREELADVVQVVANVCSIVGIEDLRPDLERCRRKNEGRERSYGWEVP